MASPYSSSLRGPIPFTSSSSSSVTGRLSASSRASRPRTPRRRARRARGQSPRARRGAPRRARGPPRPPGRVAPAALAGAPHGVAAGAAPAAGARDARRRRARDDVLAGAAIAGVAAGAIASPKWPTSRWCRQPVAVGDRNISRACRAARSAISGLDVVEEPVAAHDVGPRVEQHAVARHAVAPGAADLLVVALDRARHVAVDDEADVRTCRCPSRTRRWRRRRRTSSRAEGVLRPACAVRRPARRGRPRRATPWSRRSSAVVSTVLRDRQ